MRKFFSNQSNSWIVLPVFTLAMAWNFAQGASVPSPSHQSLLVLEGRANQIASGPTLPPPVDENLRIASGPTLPPPVDENLRIASGPTLPPPVDENLRIV